MSLKRLLVPVAILALSSMAGRAAADESDAPRSAYQLSVDLDVPLLLLGGGLASSYLFIKEASPPFCAPLCDKANVNFIDRHFAGYYSTTWQTVGDVATVSTLVLVPVGLIVGEPTWGGLGDLLVAGETVLLTSAVQVTASYAVNRPRPRVYGEKAPLDQRDDANAARSFFSGHAADCLAGTLAASTALRRVGRSRLSWAVLAVGLTGSLLVGIARVESGGHFPSDVLVGYAVGASFGIGIPALHEAKLQVAPLALPDSRGLSIAGRF